VALTGLREFTGYLRDLRKVSPGATPEIGAALRIVALIHHTNRWMRAGAASVAERVDCDEESRISRKINMGEILGRVMTVAGSQITVNPEADHGEESLVRVGAVVKVSNANRGVFATINAVRCEKNSPTKRTLFADLLGEIVCSDEGLSQFRRGVTQYPVSGALVVAAADADLTAIFAPLSHSNVRIGTLPIMMRGSRRSCWSTNCCASISLCSAPPDRENPVL
jgi:hypothetical protein